MARLPPMKTACRLMPSGLREKMASLDQAVNVLDRRVRV